MTLVMSFVTAEKKNQNKSKRNTISYLTGSFNIMMKSKDVVFRHDYGKLFNSSFNCALKTKEILRFSGVTKTY